MRADLTALADVLRCEADKCDVARRVTERVLCSPLADDEVRYAALTLVDWLTQNGETKCAS